MLTTDKQSDGERDLTTSRNLRPLLLVASVAVLCGVVGVGLKVCQKKPVPAPPMTIVPVAVRDLETGRVVQSSDFYLARYSADQVRRLPVQSFYSQGKEIVGRIVQSTVAKGNPFGLDSLFAEGTGPSPVNDLAPGFRGVTVGVKLVGGVRGFASPDAWVDVLFRRDDVVRPRSADEARTHTLFHTVKVLAVEDRMYPHSQLPRDQRGNVSEAFEITLALTPDQAEVIKTLEGRGTLSLSLLPPEEGREAMGDLPSSGVLDVLLGVVEPEPIPPAPPVADRVEMYRGGQSDVVEIQPEQAIAPALDRLYMNRQLKGPLIRHAPAPDYRYVIPMGTPSRVAPPGYDGNAQQLRRSPVHATGTRGQVTANPQSVAIALGDSTGLAGARGDRSPQSGNWPMQLRDARSNERGQSPQAQGATGRPITSPVVGGRQAPPAVASNLFRTR